MSQLVSDLVQQIDGLNRALLELYSKCQEMHDELEASEKIRLQQEAQIIALTKEIQHALTKQ